MPDLTPTSTMGATEDLLIDHPAACLWFRSVQRCGFPAEVSLFSDAKRRGLQALRGILLAFALMVPVSRAAQADEREALSNAFEKLYEQKSHDVSAIERQFASTVVLFSDFSQALFVVRASSGSLVVLRNPKGGSRPPLRSSDAMSFSIGSRKVVPEKATLLRSDPATGDFRMLFETNLPEKWIYLTSDGGRLEWTLVPYSDK